MDSSALAAILFREPEREDFLRVLTLSPRRLISAATLVESGVVIESREGELRSHELDLLLTTLGVDVVPVDAQQVRIARLGWRRYGKGRHPAGLNLGDLFSYALSKATGEPLLFTGTDFSQTDVVSATSAPEQ